MHSQNPFAGALWIVAAGAALGIGYNALRPQALPWVYSPPPMIQLDDNSGGAANPPVGEAPAPASVTESGRTPAAANPSPSATVTGSAPGTAHPTDPEVPMGEAPARNRMSPSGETSTNASSTPTSEPTSAPSSTPTAAKPADNAQPATGQASAAGTKDLYPDIPQSVNMISVSLAKAKEFYDRGGLLILDARDAVDFNEGHIKGAVSAPYDDVVGDPDLMTKYAQDPRPILCYCSGGDCELSMDLAEELTRTGHRRVLVFKEGYPGWKDAGYPVVEGGSK